MCESIDSPERCDVISLMSLLSATDENKSNYEKHRNYGVNLSRREKNNLYNSLDPKKLLNDKTFWKFTKPLFSDKGKLNKKITLLEGENIITKEKIVAQTFNDFFTNTAKNLHIKGYDNEYIPNENHNFIDNAVDKFKYHPSILLIKAKLCGNDTYFF